MTNRSTDRADGFEGKRQLRVINGYDQDVAKLIAGLIDGELERREPVTFLRWARLHLGDADLFRLAIDQSEADHLLAAVALADLVADGRATVVSGRGGDEEPVWSVFPTPEASRRLFVDGRLVLAAGVLADFPVAIESETHPRGGRSLHISGPRRSVAQLERAVRRLVQMSVGPGSLLRGRCLRITVDDRSLDVSVLPTPRERRDHLALPAELWSDIDRNIHGLVKQRGLLQSLDLGANRGVLLHGPPGTGKSQLARIVAGELAPEVTSLFVSPEAIRQQLPEIYELASRLTPALVVLDDIDLAVGSRRNGSAGSLGDFLSVVDGAMTTHDGVVTIATTNAPDALDEAALRAARFDRIIEVPLPPRAGREIIWRRYLRDMPGPYDLHRLSRITEGASGADIREIVRHAVLAAGGQPHMAVLEALTKERGFPQRRGAGHYL